MKRTMRILVPRLMDALNTNAQNLNARALLSRFGSNTAQWVTTHYDAADADLQKLPRVQVVKLWRTRLWHWRMLLLYQQRFDSVFYPGLNWFDEAGLRLRQMLGRRIPVIGTLEGLPGTEEREQKLSAIAGHAVFCHKVSSDMVERCDRIFSSCDHIIAISPMLARLGRELYGDKVSMLPLGIDTRVFHPTGEKKAGFRIIGVGSLKENKRPEVFLELARRFPEAKLVWYGAGALLERLRAQVIEMGLNNVEFRGIALPAELAREYNCSDLFVLPSSSEGAPKVLQEAAACGLPRVAFGFYEPMIEDGRDGYVVWNDEELFARAGELIGNKEAAHKMGLRAAETAAKYDWDLVAPQWENEILSRVEQLRTR